MGIAQRGSNRSKAMMVKKAEKIPGRAMLTVQFAKAITTPSSQKGLRLIGIRYMHEMAGRS
jgi:hypothetical protein